MYSVYLFICYLNCDKIPRGNQCGLLSALIDLYYQQLHVIVYQLTFA
jgi:hypothetical protein